MFEPCATHQDTYGVIHGPLCGSSNNQRLVRRKRSSSELAEVSGTIGPDYAGHLRQASPAADLHERRVKVPGSIWGCRGAESRSMMLT